MAACAQQKRERWSHHRQYRQLNSKSDKFLGFSMIHVCRKSSSRIITEVKCLLTLCNIEGDAQMKRRLSAMTGKTQGECNWSAFGCIATNFLARRRPPRRACWRSGCRAVYCFCQRNRQRSCSHGRSISGSPARIMLPSKTFLQSVKLWGPKTRIVDPCSNQPISCPF